MSAELWLQTPKTKRLKVKSLQSAPDLVGGFSVGGEREWEIKQERDLMTNYDLGSKSKSESSSPHLLSPLFSFLCFSIIFLLFLIIFIFSLCPFPLTTTLGRSLQCADYTHSRTHAHTQHTQSSLGVAPSVFWPQLNKEVYICRLCCKYTGVIFGHYGSVYFWMPVSLSCVPLLNWLKTTTK